MRRVVAHLAVGQILLVGEASVAFLRGWALHRMRSKAKLPLKNRSPIAIGTERERERGLHFVVICKRGRVNISLLVPAVDIVSEYAPERDG